MPEYGVTGQGFVLKRMDSILEEIHAELTEGFGTDTTLSEDSFLNVLVTTFAGQLADLWEMAQDSYYQKYPATADGLNLDHAVQYGGIRREAAKQTCFPLYCTGEDGTIVPQNAIVSSDTKPEIRLYAAKEFMIKREDCHMLKIRVASAFENVVYSVAFDGETYNYLSKSSLELDILRGIEQAVTSSECKTEINEEECSLLIGYVQEGKSGNFVLSEHLTTQEVTTIANFYTEDYGKIILPMGIITKIITNVAGFSGVINRMNQVYGRLQESDVELRQSYIAKSALRSNTMVDSIIAELLNNVEDVETAVGYENQSDEVDAYGRLPHSIEMIVEGGNEMEVAQAILKRKAGGIQTNGKVAVNVPGIYGESIEVHFNRPEYLYTFIKVYLHGGQLEKFPVNYAELILESIIDDTKDMKAGDSLLVQLLNKGIYEKVAGVRYIEIAVVFSEHEEYIPLPENYSFGNIEVTPRQKVMIQKERIEVILIDGMD